MRRVSNKVQYKLNYNTPFFSAQFRKLYLQEPKTPFHIIPIFVPIFILKSYKNSHNSLSPRVETSFNHLLGN